MLVVELHLRRREMQRLPERIAVKADGVLHVGYRVPDARDDAGQCDEQRKGWPKRKQKKRLHEAYDRQRRQRAAGSKGPDTIAAQRSNGIEHTNEERIDVGAPFTSDPYFLRNRSASARRCSRYAVSFGEPTWA